MQTIANMLFFFFFFQAEDGIRDKLVTGVQTCALPILKDDGFFRNTTRVQAVVSVRRTPHGRSLETVWTVFPTSNMNAQARLSSVELQQFGEIALRAESLAADATGESSSG